MKSGISLVLTILFLLLGFACSGQKQKTAVLANGETLAGSVSRQAGLSPFFILFDEKGKLIEAIDNPYRAGGSAGIPVADFLAGKGVTIVVAEGFGERIVEIMKSKGVKAIAFKGSVEEAIKKVMQSH
jgi:predicted Fe-Mo cluster-binding NifX family protein